jgi:CelD/BcsL family acetyltransferase involved in cellulose biosynthesis
MIEGWLSAFEIESASPAAGPFAGGWFARRADAAALPFALLCEDPALVRAWQRLEASASLPMQCHAFAAALAGSLLENKDIEVFLVREAGAVEALLPLARGAGFPARWTAIGAHEVCEPHDALCREASAVRRLAEAVARDGRAIELDRVPAGSPLIPALRAAMRGRGWMSVRPATPAPTIALDAGWEDPESRFNAGRRSDFRRARRRAAELGEVAFEMLAPRADAFDALFDEAVAVEARSWKREAGTAIAADRAKERCFRHFFRSACEAGTFRLAFLRIGGRAVAMQMALEWQGRYWLFKIGFDEAYERCSPGTLLMLETIGWAAARGLSAYELLGNVEPWIARFWTRDGHDCVCLRTYPFNARGGLAFTGDAATWLRKRLAPASGR